MMSQRATVLIAVLHAAMFLSHASLAPAQDAGGGRLAVPVAAIQAGETVTPDKLSQGADRKTELAGAARVASHDFAIGRIARRTLLPGQLIPIDALRARPTVHMGQAVRLVYEGSGLQLTVDGTAMGTGGAGEAIQVRNRASGALLRGTIAADGTVRVDQP